MRDEVYADGIGEITVTGPIVRIDLVSLSATERDPAGNPKPVLRQRVIMPSDGFAAAFELMRKAVDALRGPGASDAASAAPPPHPAPAAPDRGQGATAATKTRSPNFT